MNDYPSKVFTIIIFIVLGLILATEGAYHFFAPCSIHRRIDTLQHLPARCR